ncbi:hypothetical protein C7M84_006953 [Penaeus vannamei]|uniref:Uncharacterized protein n=1 Tax=Penaeus vannamei TaxID=6689 RepID=A0A3R7PK77_PENVA|nr:hypothetical protein C7M84_006953 [Penaeus vannamei]
MIIPLFIADLSPAASSSGNTNSTGLTLPLRRHGATPSATPSALYPRPMMLRLTRFLPASPSDGSCHLLGDSQHLRLSFCLSSFVPLPYSLSALAISVHVSSGHSHNLTPFFPPISPHLAPPPPHPWGRGGGSRLSWPARRTFLPCSCSDLRQHLPCATSITHTMGIARREMSNDTHFTSVYITLIYTLEIPPEPTPWKYHPNLHPGNTTLVHTPLHPANLHPEPYYTLEIPPLHPGNTTRTYTWNRTYTLDTYQPRTWKYHPNLHPGNLHLENHQPTPAGNTTATPRYTLEIPPTYPVRVYTYTMEPIPPNYHIHSGNTTGLHPGNTTRTYTWNNHPNLHPGNTTRTYTRKYPRSYTLEYHPNLHPGNTTRTYTLTTLDSILHPGNTTRTYTLEIPLDPTPWKYHPNLHPGNTTRTYTWKYHPNLPWKYHPEPTPWKYHPNLHLKYQPEPNPGNTTRSYTLEIHPNLHPGNTTRTTPFTPWKYHSIYTLEIPPNPTPWKIPPNLHPGNTLDPTP